MAPLTRQPRAANGVITRRWPACACAAQVRLVLRQGRQRDSLVSVKFQPIVPRSPLGLRVLIRSLPPQPPAVTDPDLSLENGLPAAEEVTRLAPSRLHVPAPPHPRS